MTVSASIWQLDWLRFQPSDVGREVRDSAGVHWVLTKESGFWASPGTNAEVKSRLNRHGGYRTPGWKTARTISLTGRGYARSANAARQAEARVLGLLAEPDTPGTLTCYSEIGAQQCAVYLDGEILCEPVSVLSEYAFEFSLQLVAPDPRKYAVDSQTRWTGLAGATDSGLQFGSGASSSPFSTFSTFATTGSTTESGLRFGLGLDFGVSSATGFMTLTNSGTAPALPLYTLRGPLVNPMLTARSGSIRYNDELLDGEHVVIDPDGPSVLLGGSASRRYLLNPAQFGNFTVPPAAPDGTPGRLDVGLTHEGPITATGRVEAEFAAAYF